MITDGEFYKRLANNKLDTPELKSRIEETVAKILSSDTSAKRPGMFLGKIQSGKTRAFIRVIALVFDNGYDVAIVLTKGTIALAQQTYERLKRDFKHFIDDDKLKTFDILHIPKNLTQYTLKQKLIIVSKKQADNLEHIKTLLEDIYPDLAKKKILIIDDEADYASIGFHKDYSTDTIQLNRIAQQIDELRQKVATSSFLQVTATPYSLYLQPEDLEIEQTSEVFMPIKPAFTVLLPSYNGYIGGDFYFDLPSSIESIASYIYEEVSMDELDILRGKDGRSFKIEDVLTSKRIGMLRKAIMNFIVGTCIRRIQKAENAKYSFVVHTEYNRASHAWQERIVNALKDALVDYAKKKSPELAGLIRYSYDDLVCSLKLLECKIPDYKEVESNVIAALMEGHLMVNKVNSESDVKQMLDENGQLQMVTPLNIFIGGQILDRGITIDNLIGFYYGRRPGKFQQDTVLQHSRMFGNRQVEDLAVTRFYTPKPIYDVMKRINEFDTALRQAFEKGAQENGVVFIRKDQQNRIKPCSPNKIMLSTITTLTPSTRLLPRGFQTGYKKNVTDILEELDNKIGECQPEVDPEKPFLVDIHVATWIVDDINKMLVFEEGYEWDVQAFKASMEYLSKNTVNRENVEKVWCLVKRGRHASRYRPEAQRFEDRPDSEADLTVAKGTAKDIPALMLFRQEGQAEQGWRGSPFWWPVLVTPENTRTVIFASDLVEETNVAQSA
jgi:hypothetical protein